MARTQRSTRNKSLHTASRKRSKNADEISSVPWPSLPHDLLLIILMQLGVIDFIAFSGVCRSWRSFSLSHRKSFMASREPMSVSITPHAKRACSLVDLDGKRMFKTILPNFSGRICVGVASGYLVMCGRKTNDFWLVNLITRHELKFPVLPSPIDFDFPFLRVILVFSPLVSGYILVITFRYSQKILFSLSGDAASWKQLSSSLTIVDLHAVHGKIYVLNINGTLSEMRLNPKPTVVQLKIKNVPVGPLIHSSELISLMNEKLFMLKFLNPTSYVAWELDTDKMDWLLRGEAAMREYMVFLSELSCGAIADSKKLADPRRHYEDNTYFLGSPPRRYFCCWIPKETVTTVWYFPHDCFNVNRLEE